jgi:hypothetical protein
MPNACRQGGYMNYFQQQQKFRDNFSTVFIHKTTYAWNENNKIADFMYIM